MNKMWMMGYNDGAGEFNMGDSFNNGRKLRPLIPRPTPTGDIHCSNRIHGTHHDFIALNHHLAMAEQSRKEFNPQQVVVSSRWNPTPEQLQTLEDLYRRGTRTPNAEEIQHITAQLRRYGKIEGKNVFYWFQNHKARERQKRRRQLETVPMGLPFACTDHHTPERKDTSEGVNIRTGFEVEQTKNWANPTNCSSTFSEKIGSREGAAAKPECSRPELGWIHFEEAENQQQQQSRNMAERNATWQMMNNLSCSSSSRSSSSSSPSPTSLINTGTHNLSPPTVITSSTTNPSTVRSPPTLFDHPYSSKLFIKPQDLAHRFVTVGDNNHRHDEESQTLQLFPLCSTGGGGDGNRGVKEAEMGFPASKENNHLGPRQFFEFLPLKN